MKRILSLGLVLTMLCALLTFMPASAATIVASGELDETQHGLLIQRAQ